MPHSKPIIDLAVIIPTLNEEHFIGYLLDSIAHQSVMPKEIVVVDAYSRDKTVQEIKKRQKILPNLQVYRIPRYTISRQRNFGVSRTSASHPLFLDADMEFREQDSLKNYFDEILQSKPDVAAATNLPDSTYWKDIVYFKVEDLLFRISQYIWPVIPARNLYIRREMFNKVGGFDERLKVAEDQELVHRIIKKGGRLIFLKKARLYTSVRRMEYEGRRKYILKMILYGLNILLHGRKKAKVNYEFGNFKKLTKQKFV